MKKFIKLETTDGSTVYVNTDKILTLQVEKDIVAGNKGLSMSEGTTVVLESRSYTTLRKAEDILSEICGAADKDWTRVTGHTL